MIDSSLKKKPDRLKSNNQYFNQINKLIKEKKIDNNFYLMLSHLRLEEIITLKLLSASEGINGKLYNFPFFKFISDISKEACIRYALSFTDSKKEAAMVLGIRKAEINRLIKYYNIDLE